MVRLFKAVALLDQHHGSESGLASAIKMGRCVDLRGKRSARSVHASWNQSASFDGLRGGVTSDLGGGVSESAAASSSAPMPMVSCGIHGTNMDDSMPTYDESELWSEVWGTRGAIANAVPTYSSAGTPTQTVRSSGATSSDWVADRTAESSSAQPMETIAVHGSLEAALEAEWATAIAKMLCKPAEGAMAMLDLHGTMDAALKAAWAAQPTTTLPSSPARVAHGGNDGCVTFGRELIVEASVQSVTSEYGAPTAPLAFPNFLVDNVFLSGAVPWPVAGTMCWAPGHSVIMTLHEQPLVVDGAVQCAPQTMEDVSVQVQSECTTAAAQTERVSGGSYERETQTESGPSSFHRKLQRVCGQLILLQARGTLSREQALPAMEACGDSTVLYGSSTPDVSESEEGEDDDEEVDVNVLREVDNFLR